MHKLGYNVKRTTLLKHLFFLYLELTPLMFQEKIEQLHQGVREGNIKQVQAILAKKKFALAKVIDTQ